MWLLADGLAFQERGWLFVDVQGEAGVCSNEFGVRNGFTVEQIF